ncbi:two-component system phosphate regulon sensor histidine kinase PhoR [Paenibacillus sp. V4I3]|uniref:sensor histidine kinase n=1 Tax=Paenibacillus sp. V4I3 TaxID=3042305 RepID=UPI0027859C67|nr:HAMP domain-containing sensor histidine kinase [Paenibacillus sp. V4I3]MDQ0872460.1 two-component system phosphate regulon sensor histidine kinase PhoR [Paenibacillus sp. V4I3]
MRMKKRKRLVKSKMTKAQRVRGFLFTVSIFVLIILYWLAAFYGTEWLFTSINKRPSAVVVQLINSLGGMFLWGITMAFLSRFFRSKQMLFFQTMVQAIQSMSRGDFNVSVDNNPHGGPFVELVDSINNMAVELGQLEKMRQEFISNVSHEIQSPLTSISGFSRALQNDQITAAERKHYLEIIEAESTRLSKLSDNLLKLSSLESQHHPFEPKSYRLDKQIRNHILTCEPQWVDKDIEMDVELEEITLIADEDLLSQVWTNLIHNAIKFTPNGGTIGVHLISSRDEAVIRISNNGAGISEEDRAHIFERFYKADKSRNRMSGGNGLGLSIVKKITEMHQGTIAVVSAPEEKTTFTVRLPLPK